MRSCIEVFRAQGWVHQNKWIQTCFCGDWCQVEPCCWVCTWMSSENTCHIESRKWVSALNDSELKFLTSRCLYLGGGFVLVVPASFVFLHNLYQHLKIADHNGIAFPGDTTQNIWQCCFCTKQEWTFVAVAALRVFIRWQTWQPLFYFILEKSSWPRASVCGGHSDNLMKRDLASQHSARRLSEISSCL